MPTIPDFTADDEFSATDLTDGDPPSLFDVEPATLDTSETQRLLREVGEERAEGLREAAEQARGQRRQAVNRTLLNLAGPAAFKAVTGAPIDTGLQEQLRLQREAEERAAELEREAKREAPVARTEARLEAERLATETEQANREARREAREQRRNLLLDAAETFTEDQDFGDVEDTLSFFRENPAQSDVDAVKSRALSTPGVTEEAIDRAAQRGRQELSEDADEGGESEDGELALPSSIEETEQKLQSLIDEEQTGLEAGATNEELRDLQEKIVRLKRHRDILRHRRESQSEGSDTEADSTSAPADTSATQSDTTGAQTRGPGRTPGYVPPQELGMTTGGVGGGGNAEPSEGLMQLRGGSTGLDGASNEVIVDRAMTVAVQRSSDEARRRLRRLRDEGSLSVGTHQDVLRRFNQRWNRRNERAVGRQEQIRESTQGLGLLIDKDNLTEARAPATARRLVEDAGRDGALRTVESALEMGVLSDAQANRLLDEIGVE